MKLRTIAFVAIFFATSIAIYSQHIEFKPPSQPIKLLIIDTDGKQEYYYRNFLLMARSVGFDVRYQNFFQFLEEEKIGPYDAIFFMMGIPLLKNLKSSLAQKCIKIIEDFSSTGDNIIGILFPGSPRYSDLLFQISAHLLEAFGLFKNNLGIPEPTVPLRSVVHSFLKGILQPDASIGFTLGTTLLNPKPVAATQVSYADGKPFEREKDKETDEIIAKLLPMNTDFAPIITKTLPAGMYIKNQQTNTLYLISKVSVFNFADIEENFFKNPLHIDQRNQLLSVAHQLLWEFHEACNNHYMPEEIKKPRPPFPMPLTKSFIHAQKEKAQQAFRMQTKNNKQYAWIFHKGISAGWLAPGDYFLHEDPNSKKIEKEKPQKAAALKRHALEMGIGFIYDMDLNLLWFEFNPEAYLSSRVAHEKKEERLRMYISTLAKILQEKSESTNKPLPKIFIGTDLTTNFGAYSVSSPVKDIYGWEYTKIPSPLDIEGFWKPELLDVFDRFVALFHKELPITGIFLDFEMYHAPDQAGGYSDLLDFSDLSWRLYCTKKSNAALHKLGSVADRVGYLRKEKKFADYFTFLEEQAYELGNTIKN